MTKLVISLSVLILAGSIRIGVLENKLTNLRAIRDKLMIHTGEFYEIGCNSAKTNIHINMMTHKEPFYRVKEICRQNANNGYDSLKKAYEER